MNFNLEMEKRQEKITGILECYLPKEEGFQKTVLEAMNYSMRAGGKTPPAASDAGDLPDVWRRRADHRAFYGSDGDDTYPLTDPR